jgi:hypothetical protein
VVGGFSQRRERYMEKILTPQCSSQYLIEENAKKWVNIVYLECLRCMCIYRLSLAWVSMENGYASGVWNSTTEGL